jgi:uncharacterized hydrophobic protein (TIGR00271 family)
VGYLETFEAKVFIEGAEVARRLTNFFTLLLLATVIATYGVLSNSTATVIGAMIVAPLMSPIMATAAAVVMGSARRALHSLALTITGIALVIALSYALSSFVPDITISFTQNSEIASRISPGLFALITALAAGAAGAYITARAEIADSMGGVAIAISLVPPLCVVGIALSQGEWPAAGGALLLFLTNLLAILLAGGVVFVLIGLGSVAELEKGTHMHRRAFIFIAFATLLVAVPLALSSYRSVTSTLDNNKASAVVQGWLEGTSDQVVSVSVQGDVVFTSVEGISTLPPVQTLADALSVELNRPVVVNLRVVPTVIEVARGK